MVLFVIIMAIAIQIFLTAKKVHPFLSLLIVAIGSGIVLGMPANKLFTAIEKGVGNTLGGVLLIINKSII